MESGESYRSLLLILNLMGFDSIVPISELNEQGGWDWLLADADKWCSAGEHGNMANPTVWYLGR